MADRSGLASAASRVAARFPFAIMFLAVALAVEGIRRIPGPDPEESPAAPSDGHKRSCRWCQADALVKGFRAVGLGPQGYADLGLAAGRPDVR